MTLYAKDLKIVRKLLPKVPLNDIADALKSHMDNWDELTAEVVSCPDLRTWNGFDLPSQGLCGDARLVEVGGPPYLIPEVDRSKVYDIKDLACQVAGRPCLVLGAGAGPWPHVGKNAEMMANVKFSDEGVTNLTKIAKLDAAEKEYSLAGLPEGETRFCLLANLFFCRGEPGQVVRVRCKGRGGRSFVTSVSEALRRHFGDQPVGVGMAFRLKSGRAKLHIMPSFSATPLTTEQDLNAWLRFYDMSAPLVAVGTLITHDIQGMDLRLEHFHCFSDHGEGGHYHHDLEGAAVEYEAFISPAEEVVRVDQPTHTHHIGRD